MAQGLEQGAGEAGAAADLVLEEGGELPLVQILSGEEPQIGYCSKRGADLRSVLQDNGDPPR